MTPQKINKLQGFLGHVLSLLVVFLLLSAAAVWTGKLFGHDIGGASPASPQTASVAAPDEAQLAALLPRGRGTAELTPRDSASWTVVAQNGGSPLGTIVATAPYARDVQGFAGPTPLYIYIGADGKVRGVVAADNSETPDFFRRAWEGLADKWNGQPAASAAGLQVDAVTGATFSSKAVIANVQAGLAAYAASERAQESAPTIGWPRTAAVIAVLCIGLVVSFFPFKSHKSPKASRTLRTIVLLLNVGVLGFWCGQFLSVSLLRGWVSGGLDPVAWLPTLAVLLVAVALPFLGKKHYYCAWVCPYGSLQELASRLPLPKARISATAARWMGRVRMGVLAVLLLLLWTGAGAVVLDYEPFTAFMFSSAAPAVIVLAAVFVVAGMFVPHLWCRSVCPMGTLLDLSER